MMIIESVMEKLTGEAGEDTSFSGDINPAVQKEPELLDELEPDDAAPDECHTVDLLPECIVKEICDAAQQYGTSVFNVLVNRGMASAPVSKSVSEEEASAPSAASTYT